MKKILLAAAMLMVFSGAAKAETFTWKDGVSGFSIIYPDNWRVQTQDQPTTQLRIASQDVQDMATCRVKAQKDGRLQVYPKEMMQGAVNKTLDRNFWNGIVAEFENGAVTKYRAPARLGMDGAATAIRFSFVQDTGSGKAPMYGQMIGSIQGDERYIVGCTSRADQFEKYEPLFTSIMSSVMLDEKYAPYAIGYYRDFLADAR